eukprot:Tbor_TRINITY_DN5039_c0_g4::TRINITY_DN5039_c0_g4_i1::g.13967::m.13967
MYSSRKLPSNIEKGNCSSIKPKSVSTANYSTNQNLLSVQGTKGSLLGQIQCVLMAASVIKEKENRNRRPPWRPCTNIEQRSFPLYDKLFYHYHQKQEEIIRLNNMKGIRDFKALQIARGRLRREVKLLRNPSPAPQTSKIPTLCERTLKELSEEMNSSEDSIIRKLTFPPSQTSTEASTVEYFSFGFKPDDIIQEFTDISPLKPRHVNVNNILEQNDEAVDKRLQQKKIVECGRPHVTTNSKLTTGCKTHSIRSTKYYQRSNQTPSTTISRLQSATVRSAPIFEEIVFMCPSFCHSVRSGDSRIHSVLDHLNVKRDIINLASSFQSL